MFDVQGETFIGSFLVAREKIRNDVINAGEPLAKKAALVVHNRDRESVSDLEMGALFVGWRKVGFAEPSGARRIVRYAQNAITLSPSRKERRAPRT